MPSSVLTVTPERKYELLMEARHSRLSWVQSASIPYKQNQDVSSSSSSTKVNDDGANPLNEDEKSSPVDSKKSVVKPKEDPLAILNSSPLCQEMPSSIPILRALLLTTSTTNTNTGTDTHKSNSNNRSTCTDNTTEKKSDSIASLKTLAKWKEKIQANTASMHRDELVGALDDHAFLFYYREVIDRLCMPESMDVVQGMRSFVRSFVALGDKLALSTSSYSASNDYGALANGGSANANKNTNADSKEDRDGDGLNDTTTNKNLERLVQSIQKYISSLHDSLANHSSWREGTELSSETKMMLDTFIYSKCHQAIMKDGLLINDQLNKDELELCERLDFLDHFINPSHLEIGCFAGDVDTEKWKSGLKLPITLLQSLDKMYSPAQMLRCILEVYRGVNNTLKAAIEEKSNNGGGSDGRGPSADDVLPTLILSIISAKPRKMLTVLRFLENFATEEQLRGEAGYAYTNLFGATQFIRELDLAISEGEGDNENGVNGTDGRRGMRPSLSIAPEILKKKLTKFHGELKAARPSENDNVDDIKSDDVSSVGDHNDSMLADDPTSNDSQEQPISTRRVRIPASEVTAARLRGENLTKWAKEWSTSHYPRLSSESPNTSIDEGKGEDDNASATAVQVPPLPEGFSRSYKFLSTEADDIRMSDIPSLLEEYRMLVRTTEILIMERNAVASKQHKLEMKNKKEHLDHSLAEVSSVIAKD